VSSGKNRSYKATLALALVGLQPPGPQGPPGPAGAGSVLLKVPFLFSSGTLVLQAVGLGSLISEAYLQVDVAFNDPLASLTVGTTAVPYLLFGACDVDLTSVDQFQNSAIFQCSSDILQLCVFPGASSQGSGILVYKYQP
jgi:hypothetical protein